MRWWHVAGLLQTVDDVWPEVELIVRDRHCITHSGLVLLDVVEADALDVVDGYRLGAHV
jgi:hypothetical protein